MTFLRQVVRRNNGVDQRMTRTISFTNVHDYVGQLISYILEPKSTTTVIEETSTPTESTSTIITTGK